MSDLFTSPRFFQNVKFHRHTDRAVGWLELFYDLVYVATLIQIGNFLSDNVSWLGFGQFLVMMTVVWWSWTGETFYQNRFYVDDWLHRILVFTQMFGVSTIGLSVSGAFGDLYVQFTLGYVLVRLMLVIMFWRAYRNVPESNHMARAYMTGFSIGIVIWLCSLLLPSEIHWVGWLVGIGFELVVPILPGMSQNRLAVDNHHISERFGIFTIIVLGEAFVKILDDAQGTRLGMQQFLFSIGGLTVLYSLWWLYFSDTAGKLIEFATERKGLTWVYGHLPLAVSLVMFGVGAKKLYAETIDHPGDPVYEPYRLLYTAAVVMYLLALAAIDYGLDDSLTRKSQKKEAAAHLVGAVLVAVIGLTITGVTSTVFVGIIAIVMTVQVLYSIWELDRAPELDVENHGAEIGSTGTGD